MEWHFVRHGEIESNILKIYAGRSNEGLNEKGIEQAECSGKKLSRLSIDAVYCSPLKRTYQTARIISKYLNQTPIPDEHFIEFALGPWEGLSEKTIADTYPEEWRIWNDTPAFLKIPGRETLQQLLHRVLEGLTAIRRNREQLRSVLIVTHVAIIRAVLLFYYSQSLNDYKKIQVNNGHIFTLNSLRLDTLQ